MKINVTGLILAALMAALVGCDETLQLEWHDAIGQRGAIWTGIENRGTLALINARADTVPHETIGVGDAMDFIITSKLELDTTKSTLVLTTKGKQYDASFVLYDAPFILPGIRNYRASFTPQNDSPSGAYNISATLWDSGGARQHLSLGNINLTVEGDTAPPIVTAVSATSDNEDTAIAVPGNTVTLTIATDEPIVIRRSALSFITADNTAYLSITRAAPNAANQYTAQLQITNAMPAGVLRASLILEDASGNRIGAIVKETTLSIVPPPDTAPPIVTAVSATSDNEDSARAEPGNTVTLTVTTDEPIVIGQSQLTFTIANNSHSGTLQATDTANQYTAQLQITNAMPAGVLRASLILEDASGNRTGAIVKETTLTIVPPPDVTPPMVTAVSATSDNEDSARAEPGNTVTLIIATDEPIVISQSQLTFTIANSSHSSTLQATDTANRYTAQLQITNAMPAGVLRASLILEDTHGNTSETIVKETMMTISIPIVLPAVVNINYYRDRNLTKPFTDEAMDGDTVYTKVAFAGALPPESAPNIFSAVGSKEVQYRVQAEDAPEETFQSVDARPSQDSASLICKYFIEGEDVGATFSTYIGDGAVFGDPLKIIFFVYTDEISVEAETITDWSPADFTGQVFIPQQYMPELGGRLGDRRLKTPLPNVTVTITSGPRSGERTITDINGRYLFPDVAGDTLHLLAERHRFEPKEVIVHRNHPTTLADGTALNYDYVACPQRHPGNIALGQRWPDEVRFILRETLVVHDLRHVDGGTPLPDRHLAGYNVAGIVVVYSNPYVHQPNWGIRLEVFAHEIAHAHQDAVVKVNGSGNFFAWVDTPEGRAYREAQRKDWEEFGKADYDSALDLESLLENAAQTSAYYWGHDKWWREVTRFDRLEIKAPHRFKWDEEWLTKR